MLAYILMELPDAPVSVPVAAAPLHEPAGTALAQPAAAGPPWLQLQPAERLAFVSQQVLVRWCLGYHIDKETSMARSICQSQVPCPLKLVSYSGWWHQEIEWELLTILLQVASSIRTILGPDVGPDAPLMSSGLDSLGAVELQRTLSRCALAACLSLATC